MSTVKELLQEKGAEIFSIEPDASAYEALRLMAEKNVGALLVIHREKMVGIFSERDYARNSIQEDRNNLVIPVSDLMTPDVITVSPEETVRECLSLMTEKHIRHLPVVDGGRLVGIVTIGDVGKKIIAELQKSR